MPHTNRTAPHTPPRPRPSRGGRIVAALSLSLIGGLFLLLLAFIGIESYFPLYPAIDTRFAPGYTEQAFAALEVGMTKQEVLQRLGPPLNAQADPAWVYSEDGTFGWWDFAWLARGVQFDAEGRLIETRAAVHYD